MKIATPTAFSFQECLRFLGRSDLDPLHQIENKTVFKIIAAAGSRIPVAVSESGSNLKVRFLGAPPAAKAQEAVRRYITEWLDFDADLPEFYRLAGQDRILSTLVARFYGLRLIKILNLFQAMTWAVIGQQINIRFAYTLYSRFVELFGESLTHDERVLRIFPAPEVISNLQVNELMKLQFTRRKAEYVIGIARLIASGELTRQGLLENDLEAAQQRLTRIRGIGNWTANYVLMRCAGFRSAFPIEDIGLHNAIRRVLELPGKPTVEEIRVLSSGWKGWEAYATFYLYRSLL